jgi:hypothetical protein
MVNPNLSNIMLIYHDVNENQEYRKILFRIKPFLQKTLIEELLPPPLESPPPPYYRFSFTPLPTIACKNNETFHIFGHFKVRGPPPCPHDQCWKKWVEFSLFSHSHNIELGDEGGIYAVVSIIFAPDCRVCTTYGKPTSKSTV